MAVGSSGGGSKGSGIKAGRAYVEASLDDTGLRAGLERARKLVLGFGAGIAAGGGLLAGLGLGVGGTILKSFNDVVEEFDKVQKASTRLGTSAEIISSLGYAAEQSGSSMEELEKGLAFNQKQLAANDDSFKKLGLSVEDLMKLPLDERLQVQADALVGIDNDAERAAAAMDLFGKAGRRMLPLLHGGAAGIKELQEEAAKVGRTVSGTDAANAERAGDAIARAWTSVKTTFLAVGAALLPQIDTIEAFSAAVVDGVKIVRDFINEHRALVVGVLIGATAVALLGGAFLAVGATLAAITVAVGGVVSAVSFLAGLVVPLTIVAGILVPIGVLVASLVADFGDLNFMSQTLGELWGWLGKTVMGSWQGIKDALAAGDVMLALEVAFAGLKVLWAGVVLAMTVAWNNFKEDLVDGWHSVVKEIELLWNDLGAMIDTIMLTVLKGLAQTFQSFFKGFLDKAASVADAVGSKETAADLRLINDLGLDKVLEEAIKITEEERKAREKAIEAEYDLAKSERDLARKNDALAAAGDLLKAQQELEAKKREALQANMAKQATALALAGLGALFAQDKRAGAAMNAIASGGTFGTFDKRALGILGGKSVEEKQLNELQGLRKDVKGLKGVAWGE